MDIYVRYTNRVCTMYLSPECDVSMPWTYKKPIIRLGCCLVRSSFSWLNWLKWCLFFIVCMAWHGMAHIQRIYENTSNFWIWMLFGSIFKMNRFLVDLLLLTRFLFLIVNIHYTLSEKEKLQQTTCKTYSYRWIPLPSTSGFISKCILSLSK